ncbi:deoxycytidylate deaminase [Microbacterium phage Nicole72]|uniref:Deoxycytidylate deaminase n=1 Tax=Microbacterium phage Nicole72 TaxID=3062838 RepID=A0ACD4UHP3_9CAUD|nr:deoxycytidylate deaminase [Microbacterium phage Nicole72]
MALPSDNRIIAVALRRLAVLSDESPEVRARADTLADLFDAQDAQNEDEASAGDWLEEPEARAWAKHVLDEVVPMIDRSTVFVSLVPTSEVDIKFAVETGLALMMDKPMIVAVAPGTRVPAKMLALADAVVEFDPSQPDATQARLNEAFKQIMDSRS